MAQLFGLARIGRDAVVRHTQGGEPVANLALAFAYGKKDADGKRPTQWVDASLWGQRAEALAPYLTVGVKVSVTIDEVHIETYERQGGERGAKLVGRVSNIEFGGAPAQQQPAAAEPPRQQSHQAAQRGAAQPSPASTLADMSDDVPF
ncbi:single-stranded DNA-binding protein [Achromobacter mucicolens]|uniref:single-stranded DNA-binding protein n=1 Tax=Achromobacter mucicolens TaxID=1389922 RepID=UPI000D439D9A|nr:single-stranded DNA-binding protein [Achromobacter mucicolens]PTW84013.1 single-stranded DNA-binding protein [Achromobacter mucicolens]